MAARSTQVKVLARAGRRAVKKVRTRLGPAGVPAVRRLGEELSAGRTSTAAYAGPAHFSELRDRYVGREQAHLVEGRIPLIWWTDTANYGDLLSPWLVGRVAQRDVVFAPPRSPSYVAVGSVVTRARSGSTVWGSGSFGSERRSLFKSDATYCAVRGPLTRSRLLDVGIDCPRVYGDPALLVPLYFWPEVEKKHDVGVIIRHSEHLWRDAATDDSVKIIDFGSQDIEEVTAEILSCRRIISSSLHGLIIADAYGIPNAWLGADGKAVGGSRPNGGEFKYLDYFASVNKLRRPHYVDLRAMDLSVADLDRSFDFDERPIEFDFEALLDACPLVRRA